MATDATHPSKLDFAGLLGGAALEVTFRDGTKEKVFVRELPIRLVPKFFELLSSNSEPALVELFIDRPEPFADSLTTESFNEVLTKGEELNSPLAVAWLRRIRARNQAVAKNLAELNAESQPAS